MKAGMIKRFGGSMLNSDSDTALSAFTYIRPLQKPTAKLLNQSITGGSGLRYLLSIADSAAAAGMRFDISADTSILKKPADGSEKLQISSENRYELFSSARFMLKKKPCEQACRKNENKYWHEFFHMYILSFPVHAIAYRQPAHGGTVISHPVK